MLMSGFYKGNKLYWIDQIRQCIGRGRFLLGKATSMASVVIKRWEYGGERTDEQRVSSYLSLYDTDAFTGRFFS